MLSLEPQSLWRYFHEITRIPRPSKHEGQIRAYLQAFGREHQLPTRTDAAGNVLICKPASPGRAHHPAVVLQAHMDMVCEKRGDVAFDFARDPIHYYIDGDWVKARGTTLGADNGIGKAMMLALLAADDVPHPPLECLFTVDEETGLTGASALQEGFITGRTLVNLDSEDDGEIFVGCAGGIDTVARLPYRPEPMPGGYFPFRVAVGGLRGGHSGDDIDKGRANANKLLARFLWRLGRDTDLRLSAFDGGNLRNAIPREAGATGCLPAADKERMRVLFNLFAHEVEVETRATEPDLRLELESHDAPAEVMDKRSSFNLVAALHACPHGVMAMSQDMPGLVETSTNLASVKMREGHVVEVCTSQRSSVESAKHDVASQVEAVFALAGASVTHGEGYPGWKPDLDSAILKVAEDSYRHLFGTQPKVRAIHAGLECGLFLEKYPYLDMVSIGPAMRGVHSPDERLSIPSTQRCWRWLCEVLARL